MATTTMALSVVAVYGARHHAALTDEFESANAGSWNVERVNGLIYAVMMESRGVYMASDMRGGARSTPTACCKVNEQIDKVVDGLEEIGARRRRRQCSASSPAASRNSSNFRRELARHRHEVGPARRARLGRQRSQPARVRKALNKDLEKLSQAFMPTRASRIYTAIDDGIDKTAMLAERARRPRRHAGDRRRDGDFAQRGQADRRHHPRHRSGRRRRRLRVGAVQRAQRRDRRAGALDRRVPARHAQQRGTQSHRARRRRNAHAAAGADVGRDLALLGRSGSDACRTRAHFRSDAGGLDPARQRRRRRLGQDRARDGRVVGGLRRMCATSPRPPTSCRLR